ncbi:MAG: hypothetical protein ACQES0_02540 [Bacteroidota bacterium]
MKRKKISGIIVFLLISFSLVLIGTGMLLKKEEIVFRNNTERELLLRVKLKSYAEDSVYLVQPGQEVNIAENKHLKKRTENAIKNEFINKLNKFNLCCNQDKGLVNLIQYSDKWIFESDKKTSRLIVEYSDEKKE